MIATCAGAHGNVRLSYDSTSIDFGHVALFGSRSATVRLLDTSVTDDISIDQIQITGNNPGDFSVTQPSLSSLPEIVTHGTNIPTLITVQFQAKAVGVRSAMLVIETSDGTIVIPLTGSSGAQSGFKLSITSIDFGKEAPGAWRDTIIRLYCSGPDSGTVQGMVVSEGDTSFKAWFANQSLSFPFEVAPGDSVSVAIRYYGMPLTGPRNGTLQIIGGTLNTPSCALAGESELGLMQLYYDAGQVDFGVIVLGGSRDSTVYLVNPGDVDIKVDTVLLSSEVFSMETPPLPFILRAGDSMAVIVHASPRQVGPAFAQLIFDAQISVRDTAKLRWVNLIANAIQPTLSAPNYQRIQYYCAIPGDVQVMVPIADTGNVTTTITKVVMNDANVVVTSDAPFPISLAPGSNNSYGFHFDPRSSTGGSVVLEFFSGKAVVLRDTLLLEVSTSHAAANIVTFVIDSVHSAGQVRTATALTSFELDTLVVHVESDDPNVAVIASNSIQLTPGLSSAKIERIMPVRSGYDVTISSPTAITAPAGSAILMFDVLRYVTTFDSASIIGTIAAPERAGCIDWTPDTTTINAANACGSTVLRHLLEVKPIIFSAAIRENPVRDGTATLVVDASVRDHLTYDVSSAVGSRVLRGECDVSQGHNEIALPMQGVPSGAYLLRIVVGSGDVRALRVLKVK